ncbi:hypothetical protein BUALT_Bualt03G0156400 [Buddleja alternifolia]|uniref:General transcription factor 3C polypeptide 3 n=1 Tax=Buddleja alternifolia TaxID=168488 RepID=A0AAV6XV78_9LAMI|nr:hypothetical protein BUALT_Bualt03G0156400 [Buddleja alternifolia]
MNTSDDSLLPGAATTIVVFDAVEHPLELELQSEQNNLGEEDDEEDDDGDNSDVSEEEGETEGEGEEAVYEFQFQKEMDPLSFAEEEDASGLQPYERFERIQHNYEVLAAKMRPTLQHCTSEMPPAKRLRQEENLGASFEEIMETMTYGMRRKSRKAKQKGRRKGSKNKANPEVTRKLGDATLHYAHGRFEEAISVLKEVVRLAPNLSDPYHTLGLIYTAMSDHKKALNFYMIAAHLTPKDASLWKLLVTRSIEQGDKRQANYCLNKAITAEPGDISLRFHRASLYVELGEHQKAAESYEQISRLCPDNIEVLIKATQLYQKCGQHERVVCILEDHLKNHANDANLSVVDLLASVLMESNAYARALEHIEHAEQVYCTGKEIPLYLIVKAGICHVHLGHLEKAEAYFIFLQPENASAHPDLIIDVADSFMTVGQYEPALKYYMMLEEDADKYNGYLHLKIARCYLSLKKRVQAIEYYYTAIQRLDKSADARLTLSSLLLEEDRDDEAISVLSPPVESESVPDTKSGTSKLWWRSGKIKLKLAEIHEAKGSFEAFADVLFPVIHETLFLETVQQKVKARKRLSRSVLSERVKVLDDHQTGNVFHGFRPVASSADLSKASRAKRLLQKKNAVKEAKRAAALAAGIDWKSDDSDNESLQVFREPPFPDLLKDEGNHHLIVDLCKSLSSLRRYWDALKIINLSLKLAGNTLSDQMKEELRTLGAQIEYNIDDPAQGRGCVRYIVSRHPYSFSAWNCYYRGILRVEFCTICSITHNKFLHSMRVKHKDSVPPIVISAHQFTMISQHQAAAREYLEAHKLMPNNPLINLCVGTSLINLAFGHRLQNKHQSILQGLTFLYNNSRICEDSQEALYNIARAYHHVGLVSLATKYYEKVLAISEKDYPIPVLPHENPDLMDSKRSGYCDLRREAAYNLHLIYKKSGALDLARQILKDHVVL